MTSEHAAGMGGSQVFLEAGETQSLETMIKCIVVASANDASVAVAEHIAGSEQAFVDMMNEKAATLGMADTHFEDCCGLSDSDLLSARTDCDALPRVPEHQLLLNKAEPVQAPHFPLRSLSWHR